ncbi:DUF4166 domain-containing protein [Leisingera aquaemixtae]|uniref:DUF4166 domain-containing protein n=1 Tax=Leisingera aquaemixtae TaxID=1396826 RepID=UPI001C982D0B|nr:DUF4166 domain-containing protein [Leisingera aquaemixtae]MBY6068240.1 DUF4166 domain-containing protein [Leisingera aquaemixtae]
MRDAFGEIIAVHRLQVPPALMRFHTAPPARSLGVVRVEGGNRWARLLAGLAGFPPPMAQTRFRLDVAQQGTGHVWRRCFGRHQTRSHLRFDPRRGRAVERFGPVELELSASVQQGALLVTVERARLFGLPLPRALCPVSAAMEFETPQGHLGFDISASLPRIGLLVRYSGHIALPELNLKR